MNKRLAVVAVAIIAVAAFGLAAWFYQPIPTPSASPVLPTVEEAGFARPHSPVIGPADAPVTITEFFDPSCEAWLPRPLRRRSRLRAIRQRPKWTPIRLQELQR